MLKIFKLLFLFHITHYALGDSNLMIFAPASMRDGLLENISEFKKEHVIDIKSVYLGTSSLAKQIKNGAKPDIFISANKYWMDFLESRNFVLKDYSFDYLFNDLVLITHERNKNEYQYSSLNKVKETLLGSSKRLSLAMIDAVPAGIYAKKILLDIGIWKKVNKNIAQSSNVRLALNLVARRELDYGLVYRSDTINNESIKVLYNFQNVMANEIVYPMTILNKKKNTITFYNYLKSDDAKAIMKKWGFKVGNND